MTDTAPAWKLERDAEGIAWLTPRQARHLGQLLSAAVLAELDEHLADLERAPPRGLVLISAKKSGFIAGADIREFTGIRDEASGYTLIRRGQQVFDRLEALPCPTRRRDPRLCPRRGPGDSRSPAATASGSPMNGSPSACPRCSSGIHPGFGGTVRTVRLIGVRAAMELMLTGRPVRAREGAQDRPGRSAGSGARTAGRGARADPASPRRRSGRPSRSGC